MWRDPVRVTDVRVLIHERETLPALPGDPPTMQQAVLTLVTDEGIEGHNFLSRPQVDVTAQLMSGVKPRLLGRDPLDIGAIWAELRGRRDLDPIVQGYVDVALWDIAGKVAGLPAPVQPHGEHRLGLVL
jgi:L-alanine-DL-glutamate epimerase-like enolase superfamily enzyme